MDFFFQQFVLLTSDLPRLIFFPQRIANSNDFFLFENFSLQSIFAEVIETLVFHQMLSFVSYMDGFLEEIVYILYRSSFFHALTYKNMFLLHILNNHNIP